MNLENHISELLFRHDCVIVADMGGFVANYRLAYIHPTHHTISPPSKKIAFNASLTENDGLLATHIASGLNITYSDACNMIRDFRDDCFNSLNKGEQLSFHNIGVLYLDHEKNIQFKADNSINYQMDSFGLGTVHAPVIKREKDKTSIVRTLQDRKEKSWWRLLEVIPAAAAIAFLLINPGNFDNAINRSLNSFNPIDSFSKPASTITSTEPVNKITPVIESPAADTQVNLSNAAPTPDASNNITSPLITPDGNNAAAPIAASDNSMLNKETNHEIQGNFYIVAGCFKIAANAENFKNQLIAKGYNAGIVGTYKGLQVVSCASAPTRDEAEAALQNIKQTLEAGAWVMKN